MAKKQKTEKVEVPVVETPVVETPKPKKVETKKPKWEIKDRTYFLKGGVKPISYTMKSANIHWFDEEKGYERELKYCSNQRTCFVDEMKGDQRLEHIIFRGGVLIVPKEKTVLQKLLSLYHPHRNKLFKEFVLSNDQKLKIVETFDRAQTSREIKLVYSTLAESYADNGKEKKEVVKESYASKKSGGTAPTTKIITEESQVANRFRKLAGLKS